jgi:Holliday junction resolvasome RuvABC endonuclease subunit
MGQTTVVLGLDLSLTETGWARIARGHPGYPSHTVGTIQTKASDSLGRRLVEITDKVCSGAVGVDLVVVETPFNAAYGIKPAQVFGAVMAQLERSRCKVVEVAPASLKIYATGTAQGGKLGPALEASRRLGYAGSNDNEADALWLAALGWALIGRPVVDLPATYTRALSAKWAKEWPGYIAPAPKARKGKAA